MTDDASMQDRDPALMTRGAWVRDRAPAIAAGDAARGPDMAAIKHGGTSVRDERGSVT